MTPVNVYSTPFKNVSKFAQIDIDYASDPASFSEFISLIPTLSNFGKALTNRSVYATNREVLVSVLREQYATADQDGSHCEGLLNPAHFTVATAHQPSLLTGPLYVIYKICSTLNLARQITEAYPSYHVHPVYVVGAEDHDFEEINHLHLFGNTYTWVTGQQGAVGRMKVDATLMNVLGDIESTFGKAPNAEKLHDMIRNSFREGISYGSAMQRFVMELFKGTGLIVLNMDDHRLKKEFASIIKDELLHQRSHQLIEKSQQALSRLGYKPQTYQRDINLFYLGDGVRGRIENSGEDYVVVDTDITFDQTALLEEIEAHPERFSPNVNLRPLYQEIVLPNLAYVGGGGELAYWLERKLLFEHYRVPLPILVRRNSILYLDQLAGKQRRKLEVPVDLLFASQDTWVSHWIHAHAEHEISIDAEYHAIEQLLNTIVEKAHSIEPTLGTKVEADRTRMLKDVEHLGKRLVRAEKAQNETRIGQIVKLYEKLFPQGNLQERYDNFLALYLRRGEDCLVMLINQLDPFINQVLIIEEQASDGE